MVEGLLIPPYHRTLRKCSALAAVCHADASHRRRARGDHQSVPYAIRRKVQGGDKEYVQWTNMGSASSQPKASPATRARDDDRRRVGRRGRGYRRLDRELPETLGKHARCRRLYSVIQRLYRINQSRCAKSVLSGNWANERRAALPLEEQDDISLPVTLEEYERALATRHESCPGLDGMDRRAPSALDKRVTVAHMNLWLLACCPSESFRVGVTVPIPKLAYAADPAEYHPITMSSMVCREGNGLADDWILWSITVDSVVHHR